MKVESVTYKRLTNLGNYENETVAVSVLVEDGDSPQAALEAARAFVDRNLSNREHEAQLERAREIIANPDQYRGSEVKKAQALIEAADKAATEEPVF
jgi:hypothetical protein